MSDRIFNFSAGPGVLPEDVLRQVQQDVWNIAGSGIGILEHSHRGKVVDKIFEECEADCRELAGIPSNYKILFLTGGASQQNWQIPMNFLPAGKTGDYIVTGYWATKTYEAAGKLASFPGKPFGAAHIAATSKDLNHSYIPSAAQTKYSDRPAYVHFCGNNTIVGTEFHAEPVVPEGVPLIGDLSSHLYSRPIDVTKYAMIYAGAQKNVGPAGTTLVIIRDDMVERGLKDIPELHQYRTFVPEYSRPNTPPVFAIYVMGLVFKWQIKSGGLAAMKLHNERKARHIYDVLDESKFYKGHARKDSRSLMNITFRLPTEELEEKFIKEARANGMDGLKGHRSVGGVRASTYNAFPEAGCKALGQFMRDFEKKNG